MIDYDLTNIINDVATNEKIMNHKLELLSSSNKGEGFWGTVIFGKLIGDNKTLELVFKYSSRDSKAHEKLPLRKVFLNEIKFYEAIVPCFIEFQQKHQIIKQFNNVPKCYATVKEPLNELLVLENLKPQNFKVWDRKQLMNEEHLLIAMETLAKFHGTSLAMQSLNSEMYNKLIIGMEDMFQMNMEVLKFYEQLTDCLKNTLSMFDEVNEKDYRDKFEKLCNNVRGAMVSSFEYHKHDVILHGDCFNNNVLFNYDLNGAKSMKMLDFQMAKLGSPALDLVFFFYSIAPKEHFDRLDYFLKHYHNCLKEYLKQFNLEISTIFPFEELLIHWKNVCKFGLIVSFTVRQAMFTNDNDAPDLAEDTENFLDKFALTSENKKLYHEQMKELVIHFIEREFI